MLGKNIKDTKSFLNFNIDPKYNFDSAIANLPNFFQTGKIRFLKGLIEMDFKTPSEIFKKLEFSASPLIIDGSYGLALNFRDITTYYNLLKEKENLIKSLEQANATKDKFFSIIAHDTRNSLNSIIGFSKLMTEDDFNKEELLEYAEVIFRSSKNLLDLLDNLLTWAKSQTGVIILNPEFFDLSLLIKSQLGIFTSITKEKGVKIEFLENEVMSFNAFADMNMITTVIRNLVTNAIKFVVPLEGDIKIELKLDKKFITFCIKDNGVGIPDYIITKLFNIGESHICRTGTDGESSSGLGLILCKEFIEKNGGEIWVESPGDNQGSSFYFTVPRVPNY